MEESRAGRTSRLRSLNVLVPVVSFAYYDLFLTFVALQSLVATGTVPVFIFFNLPLIIITLLLILGLLRWPRAGYPGSVIFSAFFLVVFFGLDWQHGIGVLADPANTVEFLLIVGLFPLLLSTLFYSVLGVRSVRGKPTSLGVASGVSRSIPRSSWVILVAIGFIVGGLMVGLLAGPTEARLLSNSGAQADITIVQGAGVQTNSQSYTPGTFTVKTGTTVTWVNRDATAHTVTATGGVFNSGNMDSGSVYKFTFTQAGTYQYVCNYHSWMKGTIVVTP